MARQCNTHIAGEDQEGGNQARRHTDPSAVLEAASVTACAPADNPQALWPVEKRAHFNGREGYGARDTARGARGGREGYGARDAAHPSVLSLSAPRETVTKHPGFRAS